MHGGAFLLVPSDEKRGEHVRQWQVVENVCFIKSPTKAEDSHEVVGAILPGRMRAHDRATDFGPWCLGLEVRERGDCW